TLAGISASSTTNTLWFAEPNGTYNFSVGSVTGYSVIPSSGSVMVEGEPLTENLSFNLPPPAEFVVTFAETGLPADSAWTVTIGGTVQSSAGDSVKLPEPNGTYEYSVATAVGFGPSPANGTLSVRGAPLSIRVAFVRVYLLNFSETSLTPGTNWSVSLTGNAAAVILVAGPGTSVPTLTRWSDGASAVRFYVSNGSFIYSLAAPGKSSASGSVIVKGPPATPVAANFPPSPVSPRNIPTLEYASLGIVVIAIAAVAVALIMRRSARHRSERSAFPAHVATPPSPSQRPVPIPASSPQRPGLGSMGGTITRPRDQDSVPAHVLRSGRSEAEKE
ncbi:MAG: hypothetical protein WCA77_07295, partial [Thermoplasmata archaeon]